MAGESSDVIVITTGNVLVDGAYLQGIADAIRSKNGSTNTYKPPQMAGAISALSILDGFTAIKTGSYTIATDGKINTTLSIPHSLGYTPDLFLFYLDGENIATAQTMLFVLRAPAFAWRSSSYPNLCGYHTTSTTTVTCSNVTTSYGVTGLTSTTATISSQYSSSSATVWRAGTYKWIAIKF